MNHKLQHFEVEQGGFRIEAHLQRLGKDYLVSVWGGAAHIGAVAMAQSRPSLADPNRLSASASVFCYVGHKEDDLAKQASERLAAALDAKVVVAAGIHWDDLDPRGIDQIVKNVNALIDRIIQRQKAGESIE
ncbi:MAG: hypothetical protein WCA08_15105 [Desulfoferrobacter sp.]